MNKLAKATIGAGLTVGAMYAINEKMESNNDRIEQDALQLEACAESVGAMACAGVLHDNVEPIITITDEGYVHTYSRDVIMSAVQEKRDEKESLLSRALLTGVIGLIGANATLTFSSIKWRKSLKRLFMGTL